MVSPCRNDQQYTFGLPHSYQQKPQNWRHVSNDSTWGASEPESHETGESNLIHKIWYIAMAHGIGNMSLKVMSHGNVWTVCMRLVSPVSWDSGSEALLCCR